MADSSFDIVSKIDHQEVANALNTAAKEVATRYDFKNVGASLELSGPEKVLIKANSEERALAVLDVFQTWLVKRKVSLKHLDYGNEDEEADAAPVGQGVPPRDRPQGGHRPGDGQEDRQDHPRRGAEVGEVADPGRRAAGHQQVARRPPGGAAAAQRQGARDRSAVHQPALTGPLAEPLARQQGLPQSRGAIDDVAPRGRREVAGQSGLGRLQRRPFHHPGEAEPHYPRERVLTEPLSQAWDVGEEAVRIRADQTDVGGGPQAVEQGDRARGWSAGMPGGRPRPTPTPWPPAWAWRPGPGGRPGARRRCGRPPPRVQLLGRQSPAPGEVAERRATAGRCRRRARRVRRAPASQRRSSGIVAAALRHGRGWR